jgi:hypothetical protein
MLDEKPRKYPSGAAKRRARLDREEAEVLARASPAVRKRLGRPAPEADEYDEADDGSADEYLAAVRELGPPPNDPIATIVWSNRLAALTAWHAAIDPLRRTAAVRRRAVLEAIRAIGATNSKAVDKDQMRKIGKRLGLVDKDEDGLEAFPEDAPPPLRAR